ncbi:MAG TPA: hypothetical protein VF427_00955 [Noviherbaspirillum sp.]
MKLKHVIAALWLVCSAVLAQEPKTEPVQAEAQQQAAPAAAVQENKEINASQNKAAAPQDSAAQNHAQAPAALNNAPSLGTKAPQAALSDDADIGGWIDSFLYEVKITDVLVALFSGLLVIGMVLQARRMRETVKATMETAQAADKTARAAEDALVAGQRAFMFIKEFKTFLHFDAVSGQYRWSIHPVWENSGNTPTRGLSINTTYRLLDEPLPKDYAFPNSREDLIPTIAGPKAMVEAVPGAISAEDLAAVQQGSKHFYIWGWAEYHDIFEGTKKHTTRFCNQLMQVVGDPMAAINEHNMVQMLFGFHSENNYAD